VSNTLLSHGVKVDNAAAEVAGWLRLLAPPDTVVELRALGHTTRPDGRFAETIAGYFNYEHLDVMATRALELSPHAAGVYFTFNSLNPDLLARCANRTKVAAKGFSAGDKDVVRRRWLLIDCDPRRLAGISATDAEKAAAKAKAAAVRKHLADAGWPAPVVADSGNGFHLLYRIDLPPDDGGLVERCLKALAARFGDDAVAIDVSVHNPSRITKCYGTLARKGDDLPDRPHRPSKVLIVPPELTPVPEELLRALAAEAPEPDRPAKARASATNSNGKYDHKLKVGDWLSSRGVGYKEVPWKDGWTRYRLDQCPFDGMHTSPDAAILQGPTGALKFKCLHDSCTNYDWADAKEKIGKPDPEHYDPPLSAGPKVTFGTKTSTNGDGKGRPPADTPEEPQPLTGCQIILGYFRRRYAPVFRDGKAVRAGDGRDVHMAEACSVPDSELIAALAGATDAPKANDIVKVPSLPGFFRKWAAVAWGDLLNSLPDEDEADLGVLGCVREEFHRLVRDVMLTEVTLGEVVKAGMSRADARIERNSLAGWCAKFAKPGPWRSIRGKLCWVREGVREDEPGEVEIQIAIHQGLFGQMKADRSLIRMTQPKFARRAKRYGLGESTRGERPCGHYAVVLDRKFVADLIGAGAAEEESEGPDGAVGSDE
jgi:hypothetical protein